MKSALMALILVAHGFSMSPSLADQIPLDPTVAAEHAAHMSDMFEAVVRSGDIKATAFALEKNPSHPLASEARALISAYKVKLVTENVPSRMLDAIAHDDIDGVRTLLQQFPIFGSSSEAEEYLSRPENRWR
jgi:hypothetical protein